MTTTTRRALTETPAMFAPLTPMQAVEIRMRFLRARLATIRAVFDLI